MVANTRARQKIQKYGQWTRDAFGEDAIFWPIVFESFGAFSDEGVKSCIDLLAEKAASLGTCLFEQFRSHARFVMSTALQQGNAAVSTLALRHYRLFPYRRALYPIASDLEE